MKSGEVSEAAELIVGGAYPCMWIRGSGFAAGCIEGLCSLSLRGRAL